MDPRRHDRLLREGKIAVTMPGPDGPFTVYMKPASLARMVRRELPQGEIDRMMTAVAKSLRDLGAGTGPGK